MVDLLEQADGTKMRIVEEVVDPVVRHRRDARLGEAFEPDRRRVGRQVRGDELVELVHALGAIVERRVARVVGQLGTTDHREEARPVAIAVDDGREMPIGGRERAPRRRRDPRVARLAARRHERTAPEMFDQSERREQLGHGHFDHRAGAVDLPPAERGCDRERGGETGDLVGHRVRRVGRFAGHPLLGAGDPRHRLHRVVVRGEIGVRAVGAEADDRAVHEPGVDRR